MTVNSKEENSSNFCLDFVQEFGLSSVSRLIQVDENIWENSCRDTTYRDALLTISVYRRGEPGLAGVPRLMQPQATAQHCSRQPEQTIKQIHLLTWTLKNEACKSFHFHILGKQNLDRKIANNAVCFYLIPCLYNIWTEKHFKSIFSLMDGIKLFLVREICLCTFFHYPGHTAIKPNEFDSGWNTVVH